VVPRTPTPPPTRSRLSRRSLLLGGAGLAFLAACGDSGDSGDDHAHRLDLERLDGDGSAALLAGFNYHGPYVVAGRPQRLTFLVADIDGPRTDVPDGLDFVLSLDGEVVGDPVTVDAHREAIRTPYYPLVATFDRPGRWTATVELEGNEATQLFQVDDPADVSLLQVGDLMPAIDTPTIDDARGVEPICTDRPACPLHDVTVAEALGAREPLALLVSTPAYCQTGTCGPVLDLLVSESPARPAIRCVHAEVWADAEATGVQDATRAAVVDAVGLTFEPSLFVVDRGGTIVERLDNMYDRTELQTALDRLS
jgi:hypothetical protein